MKYCPKCGAQVNDDAAYCPKCGAKLTGTETIKAEVVNDNESQNSQKAENNDGSTLSSSPESKESTAKVLGILALVFGIFGGFLGLVFGIIGLVTDKEKRYIGLDIAGIVLSGMWVIGWIGGFARLF